MRNFIVLSLVVLAFGAHLALETLAAPADAALDLLAVDTGLSTADGAALSRPTRQFGFGRGFGGRGFGGFGRGFGGFGRGFGGFGRGYGGFGRGFGGYGRGFYG